MLKLDGCIGLSSFPAAFAEMASLKTVHITHCLKLINSDAALASLPSAVQVVKEKAATTPRLAKSKKA